MARNKFDVDEKLESPFRWQHLKRAGKYVARQKYTMLAALILSALASAATLYIPKITQWVLDEAVPNKDTAMIGRMALLFVGLIALSILFSAIRSRMMAHVSQRIIYDIRSDLFAHLQKLPFSYYDSRPAGKILVLRDGKITERGTHSELLARRGYYWQTYCLQYGIPMKEAV